MNAPGSIWKTYNSQTGEITIHPDFKIMWADGTLKYIEHEGLADEPIYRSNASERVMVLEFTHAIEFDDLITTFEFDVNNAQRLSRILTDRILPGVWW